MLYLLPVSTIVLIVCLLVLTVIELSPLLRESTGSSLIIWAVLKPSCTRFGIHAADFHGWFLFFSFLAFHLVSFGLCAANCLQVSDVFALVTPGLDCATFVRGLSVSSTTSIAGESFCLWSMRSMQWSIWIGFSLVLWDSNRASCTAVFAFRVIFTVFARSRSSCWSSFCFKVWEEHFSTIWSLISSSKVSKLHDFTRSQRLVRYVSNDSSAFCALDLNF